MRDTLELITYNKLKYKQILHLARNLKKCKKK